MDRVHGETVCEDPLNLDTCYPVTVLRTDTLRQESYRYDKVGNRLDRGAGYEPGSNRLTNFNGYALTYDADGNLLSKSKENFSQTFSWNALGQLIQVVTNGSTTTYGYDAWGRRVRKTVDGVSTGYLHDGDDLVLELKVDGTPLREYAYYPGVDNPHSMRYNGQTYYYAPELPGHVAGLVNQSNQGVNEYRYTPLGSCWAALSRSRSRCASPLESTTRRAGSTSCGRATTIRRSAGSSARIRLGSWGDQPVRVCGRESRSVVTPHRLHH